MNEYTKDITKGDFGEPSFGGLAFQNKEGKTEILDENGNMETWNARYIIPPMLALIQEQKKSIDSLESRLEALEKKEV